MPNFGEDKRLNANLLGNSNQHKVDPFGQGFPFGAELDLLSHVLSGKCEQLTRVSPIF